MKENDSIQEYLIEEEGIEISRYDFNSFRVERSIRDILSWEERKIIEIPNFQREFVWSYSQSCKFIESILLNLPVPNMFIFREKKNNEEKYVLIDGLQRFTCIKQFKDGYYKSKKDTREFKIKINNSKWNGCTYDSLSENDKELFNDYSLILNMLEPFSQNDEINKLYMTDLFERINTGSDMLSAQEIRNAVYNGDLIEKLHSISKNKKLKQILPKKYEERFKDEEYILRLLTYYHIYNRLIDGKRTLCDIDLEEKTNSITTSIKAMLSQYLYYSNKHFINYNEHISLFERAVDVLSNYSDELFKGASSDEEKITNKFHDVFTEALFINVMMKKNIVVDEATINKYKKDFWYKTSLENNPFYSKTSTKESLLNRVNIVEKMISGIYE